MSASDLTSMKKMLEATFARAARTAGEAAGAKDKANSAKPFPAPVTAKTMSSSKPPDSKPTDSKPTVSKPTASKPVARGPGLDVQV